jgi:MinD superfamily P-loop ATPase
VRRAGRRGRHGEGPAIVNDSAARHRRIAVASGKGGTGKTTVSTNLSVVAADRGRSVQLLDCDVEAPNCHIFLQPRIDETRRVTVAVPLIDPESCNGCGECGEICQFNALACLGGKATAFGELCHGCGGCWRVCPVGAISKTSREIGIVERGAANGFRFVQGRLDVGEPRSAPLIDRVKDQVDRAAELAIIDCPPGTSCAAIAAVRDVDYVCMVTEPTPFGLNDLVLAVGMARELSLPMGVVINRSDIGDRRVHAYCEGAGLKILAEIPDDRRVAEAYAAGEIACRAIPQFRGVFEALMNSIDCEAGR